MKRLSAAESLEFAAHCVTCRPCAAAVEDAGVFVRAMKGAAKSFREGRPFLCQLDPPHS
jgi:hypothetical protein